MKVIIIVIVLIFFLMYITDPEREEMNKLARIQKERAKREAELEAEANQAMELILRNNELLEECERKKRETIIQSYNEYLNNKQKYLTLDILKDPDHFLVLWQGTARKKSLDPLSCEASVYVTDEGMFYQYSPDEEVSFRERAFIDYKMNLVDDPVKRCALVTAFVVLAEKEFLSKYDKDKYDINKSVSIGYRCTSHRQLFSKEVRENAQIKNLKGDWGYGGEGKTELVVYDDIIPETASGSFIAKIKDSCITYHRDDYLDL